MRKQSYQSICLSVYPPTGQGMEILFVHMTDEEVLVIFWEDKTDSEWLTTQTINYRDISGLN